MRWGIVFVFLSYPLFGASFEPYLNEGNYRIGGSVSLQREAPLDGSSTTNVDLSLPLQYFFFPRIAIGGAFEYSFSRDTTTSGKSSQATFYDFGPVLSYYFWVQDRMAAYFEPQFFVEYDPTANISFALAGEIAFQYFLTPSVAVGPNLRYFHRFARLAIPGTNVYTLSAGLNVHL